MSDQIELVLNGAPVTFRAAANALLLDVLRDNGLTGTKASCGVQVCGACTVLVDGDLVSSCCFLAHDAVGRSVTTIEGAVADPETRRIADAMMRHSALQCGFCTPGMVLTMTVLQRDGALADEERVRRELAGNLCRCTGYKAIVDAAVEVGRS